MAPEILKGELYNQECDLWSLGIIIYSLYFKEYPYYANSEIGIINQIKNLGNKNIKKTGNIDLDDLISKMLEQDQKERITWKDYFEHPFFRNNCKDKGENEEINKLKKLLQNERNKNDDLMKIINKLESELKEEKDKYIKLEEKTNKLKLELDSAIKSSKVNKIQGSDSQLNNYDSKESLYKIIIEKDKIIKELEESLKKSQKEKLDLSKIDFEELQRRILKEKQRALLEKLKATISSKLSMMLKLNDMRKHFQERFEQIIDEYNAGKLTMEQMYIQLVALTNDLTAEEKRHLDENLTEEELAILDILTKPEPKLSKKEFETVKAAAQKLVQVIKKEKLVLDWRKKQSTRAKVKEAIETICDETLPEIYDRNLFQIKCNDLYNHFYDYYNNADDNIYDNVA